MCNNPINITDEIAELYLELLCQFEPGSVLRFLETFENYRLEHCLLLCQNYGVTDAAAFLLERAGDVGSSSSLILSGFDSKLDNIYSTVRSKVIKTTFSISELEQLNAILNTTEVRSVHDILQSSVGLCQRNTLHLDSQESESLWFHLLDSILVDGSAASHNIGISELEKTARISRRVISQFVGEIIYGMVGYVPLPTIMTKLLAENGNQQFGDFKATILGLLGTYGYERRILDTTKILIEDDTYYIMSLLKKGASHAYAPQSRICCICSSSLTKEPIHVFHCGHAVHLQCEVGGNELNKNSSVDCPICMPKKNPSRARSKSILVKNGLVKMPLRNLNRDKAAYLPNHYTNLISLSDLMDFNRYLSLIS